MKRALLFLAVVGMFLTLVVPAQASTNIACSVGAFKPTAYGTAQVRGVGDIDCWVNDYATIEVVVRISNDGFLGLTSTHYCYNTYYCSWYKIQTKQSGYHCYRTVADGAVKDFNGNWTNLPSATSGAFCTP